MGKYVSVLKFRIRLFSRIAKVLTGGNSRHTIARAFMAAGVFGVLAGAVLTALPVPGANAAVGINKQINFQGKVSNANGTNVANGSYTFIFRLYNVSSAGSALWTETKSLTVTDGVFQTNLGSVTSLPGSVDFNTDNIYLSMAFNGDPEMTPRIQFTAAAYAFNSDKLQGLSAADFAQLSPASAQSGSLNVTGSVQAATSLQAPLVDTATAVALNIGTGTASSVNIGRTTTPYLLQGNASSTFTATSGANTTTVSFATPTAANAIVFPNAGGTICTTVASTCSATYMTSGNYLSKNAADTSSFAVTAANYLYGFTNSSSGVASGVLRLDNGNNTGSGLTVVGSGNPAAGQALILVNAASGVTGNLLDLQVNTASRFAVNQAGAVTTASTINGQTISATASFTGTVQAATSFLAPLHATVDVVSGTSGNITLRSGNATAGNGSSGNVTIDNGAKNGTGFAGNLYIGNTNAANVNIGRNSATASGVAVSIQGLAATSSLIFNDATNANRTTVTFATPTAMNSIIFPNAGGTVCTTTSSTCSTTYQTAGSYLSKNAADTSSSSVAGYLYGFTNSNSGAAGALSLTGAGTNSALSVTQSGNPGAGQAVILATNSNGTPTGNLLDLRVTAGSRFSVDTAGAVVTSSTINGQTISSSASFTGTVTSATGISVTTGGIAVTGNSNITGTLGVSSALTVSAGGASITGGLNNNTGDITNAGAIGGATTVTASGTIQGGGTFKTGDTTASSAVNLNSGNASAGNSGAVNIDSGTATGTAGAITVAATNSTAVTIGRSGATAPTVTLQGNSSSQIQINSGSNYSRIQFTAPTAQVTYTLGTNATNTSATICTSLAASCNTTYQPYVASGYLVKSPTANEASSSNFTGYQYTFTQSSGTSAGNLSLVNAGLNAALLVTQTSNPSAGQAAVVVNNSNATPSGNLIDLQKGGVSQFAIDASGNVTTLTGASSGKINGQTISSTASFTGTVTSAANILVSSGGITVTGNSSITGTLGVSSALTVSAGGASITGGINNNAGGITAAGAVSGLSSLQYNTNGTLDTSGSNSISIGTTNANTVTVGRAAGTLSLQGSASSSLVVSSGASNTTINFATPTAGGVIYQFGSAPGSTTYQICTSYSSSCGTTYASYYANGYVQLNPAAAQNDATAGSTIWLNKNTADTSNLVRLQAANSNVFTVQANGNMTSTGVASLGNGIMTVNPSTFKVNIGTGTPTLGSGTTGALFVSNSAEFASLVRIGDNTNNASFDATTKEVTFSGTARHQKAIRLTAEYAGAVLDAGGQSNVTGTMTAGYDATQRFGYYKWTSGLASANTFDVVVTIPVPDDWSAWNGNPQFKTYASSIAASNTVNVVSVTRTDGSADTTFTATNITPGSTSTWATYSSKGLDTTGYTAGGSMNIRIRMSSLSNSDIRLADIILPYYSKF